MPGRPLCIFPRRSRTPSHRRRCSMHRGALSLCLYHPATAPSCCCRMAKSAGKKPKGGKAKKQRKGEHKKRVAAAGGAAGGDDGGKELGLGPAAGGKGHQRNPKAFVFSGRGKAKRQAARSAEKDQRRMHGAPSLPVFSDSNRCVTATTRNHTRAALVLLRRPDTNVAVASISCACN